MSFYVLKDVDWPWDDEDEGRAIVLKADTPEEAIKIATKMHIAEFPGAGGVTWDVGRLNLVGFGDASWEDDNIPSFESLTYYSKGINGQPDASQPQLMVPAQEGKDNGDELKPAPVAWHRDKSFVQHFLTQEERPQNATSNPDEWQPLYPASALTALREECERIANANHDWAMACQGYEARATAAETEAATLRALLADAGKALEPFAVRCDEAVRHDDGGNDGLTVKVFHLRAARAVSAKIKEMTGE